MSVIHRIGAGLLLALLLGTPAASTLAATLQETIRTAQKKVVKIYGAGGFRQLEAYQTGILVSAEGHVLTVLSYVLDTDDLAVVLDDGRRLQAKLLGSDPISELAILHLSLEGEQLPYFDLHASPTAEPGARVLALSNLFGIATGDEPVSVLQGVVTTIAPLKARRGAFQSNYRGTVYVLDVYSNNPGAAGGALVDWQGQLVGVLGKELRSRVTGTWLNYALPCKNIAATVDGLIAGQAMPAAEKHQLQPETPLSAKALGVMLVPNVLPRTPPYVDSVRRNSAADRAGLRPDDLIVFVATQPTTSCNVVHEILARHERDELVSFSVLRDGSLLEFSLQRPLEKPTTIHTESTEL